jgi:hypothetical protein
MKNRLKQVFASLLAAAMVFTYMPVFGLGAFEAYAATNASIINPTNIGTFEYTGEYPDLDEVEALNEITLQTGTVLTKGTDYTVEPTSYLPDGGYVKVHFIGEYEGVYNDNDTDISYKIEDNPVASYEVTIDKTALMYDGNPLTEEDVRAVTKVVENGTTNVNDYVVKVEAPEGAKGDAGEVYGLTFKVGDAVIAEDTVTILPYDLSQARKVVVDLKEGTTFTYNAEQQKPLLTDIEDIDVYAGRGRVPTFELVSNADQTDFTITGYGENVNATSRNAKTGKFEDLGIVKIAAASDNYTGTAEAVFFINRFEGNVTIRLDGAVKKVPFNGEYQTPDVKVAAYFDDETTKAIPADDYEIVYGDDGNGVRSGDGNVRIKGKGKNLDDDVKSTNAVKAFIIDPISLEDAEFTQINPVPAGTSIDDAETFMNYFAVTLGDYVVTNPEEFTTEGVGANYEVEGTATTKAGQTGTVKITAERTNPYTKDEFTVSYVSAAKTLSSDKYVAQYNEFTYTGKALKLTSQDLGTLQAFEGMGTLDPTQYKVVSNSSEEDFNVGDKVAVIEGVDETEGQFATVEFSIVPLALSTAGWEKDDIKITGIADGSYYVGAEITGAKVVLDKGGVLGEKLELDPSEYRLTVNSFEDGAAAQKKLKSVDITFIKNYKATPTKTTVKNIDVSELDVTAEKVELSKATIEGEIPAGLDTTADGITPEQVQKFVKVKVGNTVVDWDKVDFEFADDSKYEVGTGKVQFTVSAKMTQDEPPVPADSMVTGTSPVLKVDVVKPALEDVIQSITVEPPVLGYVDDDDNPETPDVPEYGEFVYDGHAWKPGTAVVVDEHDTYPDGTVTVQPVDGFADLALGTDYTLAYEDNTDAGEATVKLVAKNSGDFTGTATETFEIAKADPRTLFANGPDPEMEAAVADAWEGIVPWPAAAKRQYALGAPANLSDDLAIVLDEGSLYKVAKGDDYTVSMAKHPVKVGFSGKAKDAIEEGDNVFTKKDGKDYKQIAVRYALVFKDSKNYEDAKIPVYYCIEPKTVSGATVSLENDLVKYSGKETYSGNPYKKEIGDVEVTLGDQVFIPRTEYTLDYSLAENEETKEPINEVGAEVTVLATFKGNYTGVAQAKATIVEKVLDFDSIKLIQPKKSELVYGVFDGIDWDNLGEDRIRKGRHFDIVYTDAEGNVLYDEETETYLVPTDAGDYVATVVAKENYGGQSYDSLEFTITPQKLNKSDFEKKVKEEVKIGSTYGYDELDDQYHIFTDGVNYYGWMTVPVVLDGNKVSDQFEVVDADIDWDGVAEKGTATVALTDDANYAYNGTAEVEFTWKQGSLAYIDVNDFYFIPDQPYTGAKVEPTSVEMWLGVNHMSADWVTVLDWKNNEAKTNHAKALVKVEAPKDDLFYTGKLDVPAAPIDIWPNANTIEFKITTPAAIEEAAEEALTAAATIDSTYPANEKKAVEEAAKELQDLKDGQGTTNQVAAATERLNKAILNAEKAKGNAVLADSAKITSANYKPAAVTAVNNAKAALEKALKGTDAAAIKTATDNLSKAVKDAASQKKAASKIKIKTKKLTIKKGKAKAVKVSGKNGQALTFKITSAKKGSKSYKKYFKINKKNGKIKVSKSSKLKKGTYKVKVKVKAATNANYKASAWKTKTIKIKVN